MWKLLSARIISRPVCILQAGPTPNLVSSAYYEIDTSGQHCTVLSITPSNAFIGMSGTFGKTHPQLKIFSSTVYTIYPVC